MIDSRFGRITLMNTSSSSHGKVTWIHMSKHSVDYIVKHLAKYYTEHNILSNCVSPGFVNTRFHTHYMNKSQSDLDSRESLSHSVDLVHQVKSPIYFIALLFLILIYLVKI